ncbi:MAG: hypothetical protein K940chlam9_01168 [Chlamydiae bacterium]|nr:hypothetical protein [Chlamydiota bacterium]
MAKLTDLLQNRFRKKEKSKMSELAEKTSKGDLTVFSGMFGVGKISDKDKETLEELLEKYALEGSEDVSKDLTHLISITSEVKAIQTQAAILHGERIKRAQSILKRYRDGAFTAWLLATYGNRQTPYNFLQYYEFYTLVPKTLHPTIESMPRQAIYTLASREGEQEKKEEIIRNYQGETKQELITKIRTIFPLKDDDGRRENIGDSTCKALDRLLQGFRDRAPKINEKQKGILLDQIQKLTNLIKECSQKR